MKVVLFCGGLGMRLREYSQTIPKPMVPIGDRPILWHVMQYYAHFGHKDFILCLGWQGDAVKDYFRNSVDLTETGARDWNVTLVDTGSTANIGQRLSAVRPYLDGEETFLANYADGLTDLHLPDLIEFHRRREATGAFLCVKPSQSFHAVAVDDDGMVQRIEAIAESDVWMNGGYFVFNNAIFDSISDGEELVAEPFERLIAGRRLAAMKYDGFWGCMDTYKEKQRLDDMLARGVTPWQVWNAPATVAGP